MVTVSTSPLLKTYTLEEFWQLEEPTDRSKLELIAGVLYMTPPPDYIHNDVVSRLNRRLIAYLDRKKDKGKLCVPRAAIWTDAHTYLEPDLYYLSEKLLLRIDPKRPSTADLVIEVVSPGSSVYDRNTKADTYGALGVDELWLIDPVDETVEVRIQTGNGFGRVSVFRKSETIVSSVLPDLRMRVNQLFE